MFSFLVAAIKPSENYSWYTYGGSKLTTVTFRGNPVVISKGQRFGVRPSANKKDIRLVLEGDLNRVITLTLQQAKKLADNIAPEGK